MKQRKIWYAVVLSILILTGCAGNRRPQGESTAPRVVTSIDITGTVGEQDLQIHYTSQEKMDVILNYLRILRQRGQAYTDPEKLPGDSYQITVHLSDGNRRVYRQHANRFLAKDDAPWYHVRQEHAEYLGLILQAMPSDQ